jgi:hypothetical protein
MLSLRNRFGIPGVISVIALVFAMLGGAYAASNSSGGGKATASKAKKGPKGPKGATGPAGPAGAQGPAGANGKDGSNGSNGSNGATGATGATGTNGANGKSVKLINSAPPSCLEGGFTYEVEGSGSKNEVCNGEEGAEGEAGAIHPGETLPSGASETGSWSIPEGAEGFTFLSFPIPLSTTLPSITEPTVYVKKGSTGPNGKCTGGTAAEPKADKGFLCVYAAEGSIAEGSLFAVQTGAANGGGANFGVGKSGVLLLAEEIKKGTVENLTESVYGTWAVTAP